MFAIGQQSRELGKVFLEIENHPKNAKIDSKQKAVFLAFFIVVFGFRIVSLTQQRTKKRLQTIFGTQPPWVWLWFFSERGPETSSKKKRISSYFPMRFSSLVWAARNSKKFPNDAKNSPNTENTTLELCYWNFVSFFLPSKTIAEKQSCTP